VLRVLGLVKRYGSRVALDGVTIAIRPGEAVGLLGANGAGKTTTLAILLGLVRPDAGRVEIANVDLGRDTALALRRIGGTVETAAFYPYLTGRQNLTALALAAGSPRAAVDRLLDLAGLTERADAPYRAYSLGMAQRLAIASALLGDPAVIVLDEPTNGLDPAGQHEIRSLVPRLVADGKAVLFASHQLAEVQQICERVVILHRGRVLADAPVSELLSAQQLFDIAISDVAGAVRVLSALEGVTVLVQEARHLLVRAEANRGALLSRALAEARLYPDGLAPRSATLEEVFLSVTADAPSEGATSASRAR
jgi:ABC-2 type transport system ATP-binding protein